MGPYHFERRGRVMDLILGEAQYSERRREEGGKVTFPSMRGEGGGESGGGAGGGAGGRGDVREAEDGVRVHRQWVREGSAEVSVLVRARRRSDWANMVVVWSGLAWEPGPADGML